MKTRVLMMVAFGVLTACAGKTLDVGNAPGTSGVGGNSASTTYQTGAEATGAGGTCVPSDCAGYTLTCTQGTPTNQKCVLDTSSQFPTPMCTLTGDCAAGAVASCSWTPPPPVCGANGGPCSVSAGIGGGSGVVSVEVDPSDGANASSSILDAYFSSGSYGTGQMLGDCVYDPNGENLTVSGELGFPAPNPGIISVTAPGFTASVTPACDGIYSPKTVSETIAAGALVSFAWTGPPDAGTALGDSFPTTLPTVPAPHFVALGASDTLAAASPAVSRANDLPVDWTVTGTPLALEQVVVLLTQGVATVTCTFAANAGSGVIPADALLRLDAGTASFDVHSLHEADDGMDDDEGELRFLVEMAASTPTGLAQGTLTLQ
jgi:hypothetical protein